MGAAWAPARRERRSTSACWSVILEETQREQEHSMSLYYVQKFLYNLNRDDQVQATFRATPGMALADYDLTERETTALLEADIGLLFHLGVNGQILMHFAAFAQIEWADYLRLMEEGIAIHGPVREGVYAVTGYTGTPGSKRQKGDTA